MILNTLSVITTLLPSSIAGSGTREGQPASLPCSLSRTRRYFGQWRTLKQRYWYIGGRLSSQRPNAHDHRWISVGRSAGPVGHLGARWWSRDHPGNPQHVLTPFPPWKGSWFMVPTVDSVHTSHLLDSQVDRRPTPLCTRGADPSLSSRYYSISEVSIPWTPL